MGRTESLGQNFKTPTREISLNNATWHAKNKNSIINIKILKEMMRMGDILNKVIINRKEQLIQQMLKWESYKSTDDRQLYELTLSELEHEYQKMYKDHSNIR